MLKGYPKLTTFLIPMKTPMFLFLPKISILPETTTSPLSQKILSYQNSQKCVGVGWVPVKPTDHRPTTDLDHRLKY